jgi:cytochrome c
MAPRHWSTLAATRLCFALAGLTMASSQVHAQPAAANFGETVARRNCSQCHAIGEMGDSPNAKAPRFRELHKRFVVNDLHDRLLEQMMSRHTDMPQFRLSMEELVGLVAYMKSIQADLLSNAGSRSATLSHRAG